MAEVQRKIDKRIDELKSLACSTQGKVLVANVVLLPVLYYVSSTYLPPRRTCEILTKTIFAFLYGEGRREDFPRKLVHLSRDKGGLGLDEIEQRCKAIYIHSNVLKPSGESQSHQRGPLFKFFCSFWLEDVLE